MWLWIETGRICIHLLVIFSLYQLERTAYLCSAAQDFVVFMTVVGVYVGSSSSVFPLIVFLNMGCVHVFLHVCLYLLL